MAKSSLLGGIVLGVLLAFLGGGAICVGILAYDDYGSGISIADHEAHEKNKAAAIFLKIKQKAELQLADPEDIWLYSHIIKDKEVRASLGLKLSQQQADNQSKQLYEQALKANSPSAKLAFAFTDIQTSVSPQEELYRFDDKKIANADKVAIGLDGIIGVLKTHCYTRYSLSSTFPYYDTRYNPDDAYDTLFSEEIPSGLVDLSKDSVMPYPFLYNRLDAIALRKRLECEDPYYSKRDLAHYLAGDDDDVYTTSWHTPLRQQVFLSVLAEKMHLQGVVVAMPYTVQPDDKQDFEAQRQSLLTDYNQYFADTKPVDGYTDEQ